MTGSFSRMGQIIGFYLNALKVEVWTSFEVCLGQDFWIASNLTYHFFLLLQMGERTPCIS